MKRVDKAIITCAVTGSVHTPSMSPHLPITPAEIAEACVTASEAGASVIHLHARDPVDGRPSPDPQLFLDILERVKGRSPAVINITTGGSNRMTLEDRLAAPLMLSPELCSFNMGTMNFVFSGAARRVTRWRHDWEEPYVLGSDSVFSVNTLESMRMISQRLGEAHGTRFEYECYDIGHLYMLAHLLDQKLATPPLFVQVILGILGGIGADAHNLSHMIAVADRLFGEDYLLSVLAAGRHQIPLGAQGIAQGGHIRVGLEDSLYVGRGELARSNADQVALARRVVEDLGREVATPDDVRTYLALKGPSHVAF